MNNLTPVPDLTLPAERRAAARGLLETTVSRWPDWERRRRHRLAAAGAGVAVALCTSAAAFAYVQQSQPVTNKSEARCYTVATLAGGDQFHGTTIAAAGKPGSAAQVNQAVSVCAALWRQGFLVPGAATVSTPRSGTADRPVPPLVACVMPGGTAAVFPGDSRTCARLGLPQALG